jgi:flavin-dependent dehydrogenase
VSGRWDAVVVGGGPAGAIAAARLAAAGRRVVLLERQAAAHDKVCGEFISAEARPALEALGLDLARLGAVPIRRLRLASRARECRLALPFEALSLSRRVLDEALLDRAAAAGAEIRRGVAVRRLAAGHVETSGGEIVAGEAVVLATGKHDLPGARRAAPAEGAWVGFKMRLRLAAGAAAAVAGTVELYLFRGGYAGLEPIEGGRANLCLVVRKERLAEMGRSWPLFLPALLAEAPLLAERLADAAPCWTAPLAIAGVPYEFVHRARADDAAYRVGDQFAVVPSFAGDGIAMALHGGAAAATAILAGVPPQAFHRRLRGELLGPVRRAGAIALLLRFPALQGAALVALGRVPRLGVAAVRATRLRLPEACPA